MAYEAEKGNRLGIRERIAAWYWNLDWNLIFSSRRERKEIQEWQSFWNLVWAEALGTHSDDDDLPLYYRHRDYRMLDGRADRHVMFTLPVDTERTPEDMAAAVDQMELGIGDRSLGHGPYNFEFMPAEDHRSGPSLCLFVTVLDTSPSR